MNIAALEQIKQYDANDKINYHESWNVLIKNTKYSINIYTFIQHTKVRNHIHLHGFFNSLVGYYVYVSYGNYVSNY